MDYKRIYIQDLVNEGLEIELAVAAQEEVWCDRSRYQMGACDEAAVNGQKIYNSVTHPITNPLLICDGNGKQKMPNISMLPRNGVCEVCGRKRKEGERQYALHHIAHRTKEQEGLEDWIGDEAVIEVCERDHANIEGQGARYTVWVMEMGGVI